MGSFKFIEMLSAGGDMATLGIFWMLLKHHTRLTRIETKLEVFHHGT